MIHTIKTIDYNKAKFTDKECEEFCKKMGIVTNKEMRERHPDMFTLVDKDKKKKRSNLS